VIERIDKTVARELDRFGPLSSLAPLVEAWSAAVGPEIARNAWPARVGRDGTLRVHTSSSAWAFELSQLEPQVRAALGELAPARLRFAPGPLPEAATVATRVVRTSPEPSAEQRAHAAELVAGIDDENLRKIVAKAAAASLASAGSDRRFW
jgi:hypothetical protein